MFLDSYSTSERFGLIQDRKVCWGYNFWEKLGEIKEKMPKFLNFIKYKYFRDWTVWFIYSCNWVHYEEVSASKAKHYFLELSVNLLKFKFMNNHLWFLVFPLLSTPTQSNFLSNLAHHLIWGSLCFSHQADRLPIFMFPLRMKIKSLKNYLGDPLFWEYSSKCFSWTIFRIIG